MSIATAIEEQGHEVVGPASSLSDPLELISKTTPDLALVDINLGRPGDGIVLAKQLDPSRTSAVFMTGSPTVAKQNSRLAIGYMCKPFAYEAIADITELVGAIRSGAAPPPLRWNSDLRLF